MKHIKLKIFSLILALMLALFATGTAFAWFTIYSRDLDLGGASAGAYFAYGDGSVDNSPGVTGEDNGPFGITSQEHLYNLAWLQNTGRIDDGMYFELGADIKIDDGYVLPPIGNTSNPFNGVFNGNGHIIKNLIISTNKDVLYGNPADEKYVFSNAVGMFGMTGGESEITNFILSNPTVEVAGRDGSQTTSYAAESDSDPQVVGLAIGYVANKASSIGVIGGTLAVRRGGYSTKNSIIGKIDIKNENNNNLTGGTGGSGSAFGASFDVEGLYERLEKIGANQYDFKKPDETVIKEREATLKSVSERSSNFPLLDATQSYWLMDDARGKLPFTVLPENSEQPTLGSTYVGNTARELVADNNIGYLLGNQDKFDNFTLVYCPRLTKPTSDYDNWYFTDEGDNNTKKSPVDLDSDEKGIEYNGTRYFAPSWLYTVPNISESAGTVCSTASGFAEVSDEKFNTLPQSIKDIVIGNAKKEFETIRLQGGINKYNDIRWYQDSTKVDEWSDHGVIYWNGKAYGSETDSELSVALPNSGIWFKPIHVGTCRFIILARDNGEDLAVMKILRTSENVTEENPFYINKQYNTEKELGLSKEEIIATKLPKNIFFYFEFDVTAEDIKNGAEYIVCRKGDGTGGARFVYMDIGASAESTDSTTEQADSNKFISEIDFIYGEVHILQEDIKEGDTIKIHKGTFIVGTAEVYKETGTMLSFGGSGAIVCFYYRDAQGSFAAEYWDDDNDTDTNSLKQSVADKATITGGGNDVSITKDYKPQPWVP